MAWSTDRSANATPLTHAAPPRRRRTNPSRLLWPVRQGVVATIVAGERLPASLARAKVNPSTLRTPTWERRYAVAARGLYRVFNAAAYRFYRSNSAPPEPGDAPFATSASLPHEPTDTYADGTWYLSASYFNGVLDSGFLPLWLAGETYLRLDLDSGVQVNAPPAAPGDWRLQNLPDGVVRVVAFYFQTGILRADEWAITYTIDGSDPGTPPAVAPTVTIAMPSTGLAVLAYELPAQAQGTEVRVRLQTRRDDGGWLYSVGSTIKSSVADEEGSAAGGSDDASRPVSWPGRIPEDL